IFRRAGESHDGYDAVHPPPRPLPSPEGPLAGVGAPVVFEFGRLGEPPAAHVAPEGALRLPGGAAAVRQEGREAPEDFVAGAALAGLLPVGLGAPARLAPARRAPAPGGLPARRAAVAEEVGRPAEGVPADGAPQQTVIGGADVGAPVHLERRGRSEAPRAQGAAVSADTDILPEALGPLPRLCRPGLPVRLFPR
ncbi:hypothetical protein chiPu_0030158, partial [Chiloscyllium punctatum]|nr:hypothetical protein [Chiloscyllium punctatum]